MIQVLLQAGTTTDGKLDIVQLLLHASDPVKVVLLLLMLMSMISWYVIGTKSLYLSRAMGRSSRFLDAFWKTSRLDDVWKLSEDMGPSPISEVFRAGYVELAKLRRRRNDQGPDAAAETHVGDVESIERSLSRARTTATTELESKVPFLATTASAAPFIGLTFAFLFTLIVMRLGRRTSPSKINHGFGLK